VLLCTPPATHLALARQALAAGRHVLVEKPVCASHAEVLALRRAAASAGRVLAVTFNNRQREENRWFVEQVRAGRVGTLARVRSEWQRSAPAPTSAWARDPQQSGGGGVLADLGSHLISIALDLVPARQNFTARAELAQGPAAAPGIEDRARCAIRIDADVVLELETAWGVADLPERARVRFEAQGSRGSLSSRDYAGVRSDGYGHVLASFAEACERGAERPGELDLVDDASQLLHALYRSARDGKDVSGRFAAARGDRA